MGLVSSIVLLDLKKWLPAPVARVLAAWETGIDAS